LVLIPSGYKEDTVYSVVPSNGSGDMSFTRASDGTRINFDGLVENTPWNLFQQSETFENASWTKNNISVATGIGTTPEGLPYRILTNTVNGFNSLAQTPPLVIGNFYSVTIVLKKGTAISVGFRVGAGTWGDAKYNFDTDTFVGSAVALASRRFLGDGWIEIKYQNFEALQTNFKVFVSSSTTGNSLDGLIGQTLLISRMQVNIGSTAKPYFPTTDRLNVPRLTYQNGGGGCPSLLLEPQRTNVYLYSSDFSNAAWLKSNCTQTPNFSTSVISGINATKIDFTTIGFLNQTTSFVGNTTASIYVIVKADTLTKFRLVEAFYFGNFVEYDLVNKTATGTGGFITDLGNGWFQCGLTKTYGVGQTAISYSINSISTIGSLLICGAQAEAGTYATSYIPTVASSATRIADACSKTGISSLIGQTEGVLFCDVNLDTRVNFTYFAIAPNVTLTSNYIGIGFKINTLVAEVVVSSVAQAIITLSNSSTGRFKLAMAYKANDIAFYVNGTLVGVDTIATIPTCSQLGLYTYDQNQSIKYNQAILFPTRLTNSELAQITTI
jgi:hypothetical protein